MNQNVAHISKLDLCCSCGACIGVCSKGAISFIFKRGLFIPEIDENACVSCGLCLKVCPSKPRKIDAVYGKPELFSDEEVESYIAYSNNDGFRSKGTSGGVVSTIIYELLKKGIYEKAYVLDYERFDGVPAIIKPVDCPENVIKAAKSKYIPASVAIIVKDVLSGTIGRSIVVATPCQMLAIKESFKLKKQSEEDVLFIGLFCDKTLNYNIYDYFRNRYGEYDSLHFRDKEGKGWPGDTVLTKDGKVSVVDKSVRMSLKPYFQLNRCRFCFDKLNQLADISCGDCYIGGESSKEGKSSIIIRTEKGRKALVECSNLLELKASSSSIIKQSQNLYLKLDNYERNNSINTPFILPPQDEKQRLKHGEKAKDLKKLRLGAYANSVKDFKKIDNLIASERRKPAKSKLKRCLNRIQKLFYNPDHSIRFLIDNAGFNNKGAELMLQSVVQQIKAVAPKVRIIVPSEVFYENLDYCQRYSILPLDLVYGGRKKKIKRFIYSNLLNKPWFVTPDQIDVVLDAGGFQFSDQWVVSKRYLAEKKRYYASFTKKNRKIIFLPQAYGPFEKPLTKQLMQVAYNAADLIYAREPESYRYLKSLFPEDNIIKISPDFTCLSKYYGPKTVDIPNGFVILIPNVRMITHTSQDISTNYFHFLYEISEYIIGKGESLVLLNHEGEDDLKLLLDLNNKLSKKAFLLSNLDALEVKRIIGEAKLLISSRFHGVVSGLTQGIPTLCTSWSHKYHELLKEHKCEDNILDINDHTRSKQIIEDALDNPSKYSSKEGCDSYVRKKACQMWDEIWEITGFKDK